jgi:hypothetical protein
VLTAARLPLFLIKSNTMKFQIREGYVAHLLNIVDLGDGKTQAQEINYYGGQVCDLNAEQADLHAHKLEPKDKAAEAYLAAKVAPQSAPVMGTDIASMIATTVQAVLAAQAALTAAKPVPAAAAA